jgi:hypothetical protein
MGNMQQLPCGARKSDAEDAQEEAEQKLTNKLTETEERTSAKVEKAESWTEGEQGGTGGDVTPRTKTRLSKAQDSSMKFGLI